MKNWTLRIQMQFIYYSWESTTGHKNRTFEQWPLTFIWYIYLRLLVLFVLLSRMEKSISVSLFKTSVASYLNSFRITHKWQTDIYTFTEIIMSIFIDQNYLIWISSLTLSHFSLRGSNLWNLWEQFPWYILSCLPLHFFFYKVTLVMLGWTSGGTCSLIK